jgi:hypothetical protein
MTSKVVVESLTLLIRIRNVPGSNLGPETGYTNCGFSWISSVPPVKYKDSTLKLGHERLLPHLLQFIIHLSTFHSTLHSLSYRQSVSK